MLPHGMPATPLPVKRLAPQAMLSQLRIWLIMRSAPPGTQFVLFGPQPVSRRQNVNAPGNSSTSRLRSESWFFRRSKAKSSHAESCVALAGAPAEQADGADKARPCRGSVDCHSTRHACLAILAQDSSKCSGGHRYDRSSPGYDASYIARRFSAVLVTSSLHYPLVSSGGRTALACDESP